jgi:anti-sigma factor RsiW
MADIIRLRGSPHEQAQELLPWYANGTLAVAEATMIEAHLAECDACRIELASEHSLARAVAGLPVNSEHGWAAMSRRLDSAVRPGQADRPGSFFRRRIAVGWSAAITLVAATLVFTVSTTLPRAPAVQAYHALGAAPSSRTGNIVILFKPAATEQEMRAAMIKADARLVDGPSASGSYVVRVAAGNRSQALDRLRASPQIALAEPIDAATLQ